MLPDGIGNEERRTKHMSFEHGHRGVMMRGLGVGTGCSKRACLACALQIQLIAHTVNDPSPAGSVAATSTPVLPAVLPGALSNT